MNIILGDGSGEAPKGPNKPEPKPSKATELAIKVSRKEWGIDCNLALKLSNSCDASLGRMVSVHIYYVTCNVFLPYSHLVYSHMPISLYFSTIVVLGHSIGHFWICKALVSEKKNVNKLC